jgi:hypothetical protein
LQARIPKARSVSTRRLTAITNRARSSRAEAAKVALLFSHHHRTFDLADYPLRTSPEQRTEGGT